MCLSLTLLLILLNRTKCDEKGLSPIDRLIWGSSHFVVHIYPTPNFRSADVSSKWKWEWVKDHLRKKNTVRNKNLIIDSSVYVTRLIWIVAHWRRSSSPHYWTCHPTSGTYIFALWKPLVNDIIPIDIKAIKHLTNVISISNGMYIEKNDQVYTWRRHYYPSSLDLLWGDDNYSSSSCMKSLLTWHTSSLFIIVRSTSGLHKVSSSMYSSTRCLTTISNT